MSNHIELKRPKKDENPSSNGGRKTTSLKPPEQTLKCPRCDSTNTKFCYYNNYNLTQPRHFCKTCRRYWTKGGALRNIPLGGGFRKNKKTTKSSSSKFIIGDPSSNNVGLKLLDGFSSSVMDFQLGGLTYPPRANHFSSSYGQNNAPNIDHFMNIAPLGLANFQEKGFTYTNHTSSIESLSTLNQDFQETSLQPILFQNLEISKPATSASVGNELRKDGGIGGLATEWFLDNNYAHSTSVGNDQNPNISNWNGIQAWNHMNSYNYQM